MRPKGPKFNYCHGKLAILHACTNGEKNGKELLETAGYKSRTGNFKKGLQRLVDGHYIELTIPDKPRSSKQKYRLTEKGLVVVQGSKLYVKVDVMYTPS